MASKGAVYHHKAFQYLDGPTGNKYFVLLNDTERGGLSLVVKTTSRKKKRPATPGCLADQDLFFIPAKNTQFPKDTWVQLFKIYKIDNLEANKDVSYFGHLPEPLFKDLLDCLLLSQKEDLTKAQLEILGLQSRVSFKSLADHFKGMRP